MDRNVHDDAFADLQRDLVGLLPRLRRFARGLTGTADQADDLVQEACEKALRNAEKWRPGTALDSWMYRIFQNCWRDQLRSDHRRYMLPAPLDVVGPAGDAVADADARLTLQAVANGLRHLNDNQRTVVLLVCVEGRSYTEAADILGWPMGTVMSRLARARVALHDFVESGGCSGPARGNVGRHTHA